MDQKDLNDFKNYNLEQYIPIIGRHLSSWRDVKTEEDAVIFKLSGLSNISCMVKAKSKSISPRYVIFKVFVNPLCDRELESTVFEWLSDQGLAPVCYFQDDNYRIEQSYDARPITIFEMRNPLMLEAVVDKIFKLNNNPHLKEKLSAIKGDNAPTQIEIVRNEWLPKLAQKWQRLHDLTTVEEYKRVLELVKGQFLYEGFLDYFDAIKSGLVDNRDNLVVCHNDLQEWNILSMRHNATELTIIDYEYVNFGPKEYDVAACFGELMKDNAFPFYPFSKLYLKNCLSKSEFEHYSQLYLSMFYDQHQISKEISKEKYIEDELPQFIENLFCWMLLDCYNWCIENIISIEEDKVNDKIFNYAFAGSRIQIIEYLLSLDFFKEVIDKKLGRTRSVNID